MSKILVTGANGFVGKYIVKTLLKAGYEVVSLTSNMGHIAAATTWQYLPKTDAVIHLAAKTFVPESWQNPAVFLDTNANGTLMALEYCKKHNAKLIFISSYLYGNPKTLPIKETAPIFTPNPYALAKKIAEDYCTFYAENFNVPVVIIRPFNIYGHGQPSSFLIPMLIHQMITDKAFAVKDLEPKRDYIYITDFVEAVVLALTINSFEIINIGSETSYSVAEIITLMQQIEETNYPVFSDAKKRQAEIMNTLADISKAHQLLHWKPKVNMLQGLQKMIQEVKCS
ncbi:MAG: NAD(P)-dependent oxidoreductase [Flavobacterium sp.]|nr:NAD(P)-dependent oxidoreductase [Flavobacterium sp.]